MNGYLKIGFKTKVVLWCIFFIINFFFWYHRFFSLWESVVFSLLLAVEIGSMFFVGYSMLSKRQKFPKFQFWCWVFVFSLVRFLFVYYILQHNVPVDTVFKHPERAIYYIIGTSAAMIFFGYSYSIYEWGLAAREKFIVHQLDRELEVKHPIGIRSGGRDIYLMPQDIHYLEATGEYVNYFCKQGNYMCFQRMKKAEDDLKKYGFIRIHRSYIINPAHIIASTSSKVQLIHDLELPVSKGYKNQLKTYLNGNRA